MLVKISDVRLDEILAPTTVMYLKDRGIVNGLIPLAGLNIVAGKTGSGKTLLAEALWLGVSWSIAKLLGYEDIVRQIVELSGIRPLSLRYEVCFDDTELYRIGGRCVKAEIVDGFPVEVKAEGDREALALALAHIIALPHQIREFVAISLPKAEELWKRLTERRGLCEVLLAVIPPVYIEDKEEAPCHAAAFDVEAPLIFEHKYVSSTRSNLIYLEHSLGEISMRLLDFYHDATEQLRSDAISNGISTLPLLYIDDGFDGIDGGVVLSYAQKLNTPNWSLYVTTHRLEAAQYASKVFYLTCGTWLSRLVEKPKDFRFALVDEEALSKEMWIEACKEIVHGDEKICAQYAP